MRNQVCLGIALLILTAGDGEAAARVHLDAVNRRLCGQLVDHTHNHGADNRIWSPILGECRDLYVYLPPRFDPRQQYPVVLWLHGVLQDERTFVVESALYDWDQAMASGCLPPMIIALPDGSRSGRPALFGTNPLWLNSRVGSFEDYAVRDVWDFVNHHYPVRPEREAHVIGGFSGGGMAAYRCAIKYRDLFGVVFGIHPPLNIRWLDCHGRYFAPFDPNCWGWREDVSRGHEPIGRFYGLVVIRVRHLVYPLFGRGPESVAELSRGNPIEMLDFHNVQPGELAMYVAYGGRDQFNVTAQADSFIYRAGERGLEVSKGYLPRGRHDWKTARKLSPGLFEWLAAKEAPYSPRYEPPCVFIRN